jgi:phage-related protein
VADFNWVPAPGASMDVTPRVQAVSFGDGYSQRAPDGINSIGKKWSLRFVRSTAVIAAIDAFLVGKKGATAFTWVPPRESAEVRVVCAKWSRVAVDLGIDEITCEFERVYE